MTKELNVDQDIPFSISGLEKRFNRIVAEERQAYPEGVPVFVVKPGTDEVIAEGVSHGPFEGGDDHSWVAERISYADGSAKDMHYDDPYYISNAQLRRDLRPESMRRQLVPGIDYDRDSSSMRGAHLFAWTRPANR